MSARTATHDLSDPAFPHGTQAGYWRGCNATRRNECPAATSCVTVMSKRNALLRLRRLEGKVGRFSHVPSAHVRQHVLDLLATVPGATVWGIAMAAGRSHDPLYAILKGRDTVRADLADDVLKVTPEMVRADRMCAPREEGAVLLRSLVALGYPMQWLDEQMGRADSWTSWAVNHPTTRMHSSTLRGIEAMVHRLGDRVATPEVTGRPQHVLDRIRRQAAAKGWHVPAAYDDGVLVAAQQRDDAREAALEQRETKAAVRLRVITLVLRGIPTAQVAFQVDMADRTVERLKRQAGLRMEWDGFTLKPRHPERAAELRAILDLSGVLSASDLWGMMVAPAAQTSAA